MGKSLPVYERPFGSLASLVRGSGPPLVLLPGLSPENGLPVGIMRAPETLLMSSFANHFTVHWVARPTGLRPGTTLRDIAGMVAAGIEAEIGGPAAVLGISTGGSIAQQLAADHPALVSRLVLVSTGYRLTGQAKRLQGDVIALTGRAGTRRVIAALAGELVPPWRGRTLATAVMYLAGPRLYPGARNLNDLRFTLLAEDDFDLRELPPISAPTLVISGTKDRFYEQAVIRETAGLIPDATLALHEGRGHVTVVSDRRALAQAIGFLTAPG